MYVCPLPSHVAKLSISYPFFKNYTFFLKNSGRCRKIFYIALCLSAYSMSCQRGAAAEFRVAQFGEGPKIFTD